MEERMRQVEFLSGVSENKPRVFQEIDNNFIDLRMVVRDSESKVSEMVANCERDNVKLRELMKETERMVETLEAASKLKEEKLVLLEGRVTHVQ
jgi:hypothetical protein